MASYIVTSISSQQPCEVNQCASVCFRDMIPTGRVLFCFQKIIMLVHVIWSMGLSLKTLALKEQFSEKNTVQIKAELPPSKWNPVATAVSL